MHTSTPPHDSQRKITFESKDLAATEDFLIRNYTKMSVSAGESQQPRAQITRQWLGPINFDEIEFDFEVFYSADPLNKICLCRVHDGHIEEDFIGEPPDVFAPGDVALLTPPELPYSGRVCKARYDLTMFEPDLLNRVATPRSTRGESVRLLGHRPVSAEAGNRLARAIDYVRLVIQDDIEPTPLIASTTASMLAAVVLASFPTNAATELTATDRLDAKPALLRRALAFIEASADDDIALIDIARHIHVTPRALQYMFRRHLDTTPMEYLRRVRLDHAHRELVRSDPGTATVQSVAARWGFAHTGRFAELYRHTYQRNPSETLRG